MRNFPSLHAAPGLCHLPALKAWGGIPCIVNPHLASPTRRKTSALDPRLLAHHSTTSIWKPSFIPSDQAQVLRVLLATRREAAHRATRVSNRLNNLVLRFGHTFGADCSMRSAEGEGILSDLIEGAVPSVPGVVPDGLPEAVRPLVNALLLDMKSALKEADHATSTAVKFIRARDWPTGKGKTPGTQLLGLLRSVPGSARPRPLPGSPGSRAPPASTTPSRSPRTAVATRASKSPPAKSPAIPAAPETPASTRRCFTPLPLC